MARPSVAIIGRPNTGKSTLFNHIVGRRVAIEDPTSGVTRDRILRPVTIGERTFDLIDTGGIGIVDRQDLSEDVEIQIQIAIQEADVLVFLVDCREGVTPLDIEVAHRLRQLSTPLILAANKADTAKLEENAVAFYELGLGDPLTVSGMQGRGIQQLLEEVMAELPETEPEPVFEDNTLKLAFIGKRNAGKSSMINKLSGAERVIVSSTPGTTRDAVDVLFEKDGNRFVAIDTAGLRKRGQMDDAIEFFGQVRSERALRRADVVIFMVDASVPLSKVDKRIGQQLIEECKPCVIAINKWDLALEEDPEMTPEAYHEYFTKTLPGLWFAPIVCTSALEGDNIWEMIDVAGDLHRQACQQVTTGQLNKCLQEAFKRRRPSRKSKRRLFKIYYGTQTDTTPPTFVVFCNDPSIVDDQYTRYLANQMRQAFAMEEIPLRIEYRTSHDRDK